MPFEDRRFMGRGPLYGMAAGLVFLLGEFIVAAAAGAPLVMPVRMMASVVLGEGAMAATPAAVAVPVGLLVHFVLSALFGLVYGAASGRLSLETRANPARQAALGMLFGLLLYLVDFQLIARAIYPWFLRGPQLSQVLLHAVGFGLPLALMFAASQRRSVRPEVKASPTVPSRRPV